MKFFIISLMLVSFVIGKDTEKKQYLDDINAHLSIQNGKQVLCEDSNGKKYYLHSSQFVFTSAGLYFYNVDDEPITTHKCILER